MYISHYTTFLLRSDCGLVSFDFCEPFRYQSQAPSRPMHEQIDLTCEPQHHIYYLSLTNAQRASLQ